MFVRLFLPLLKRFIGGQTLVGAYRIIDLLPVCPFAPALEAARSLTNTQTINQENEKMLSVTFFALLAVLPFILAIDYETPGQTFEAKQYTVWNNLRRAGKSRRAEISVDFKAEDGSDDYIHAYRLDLVGNSYDRGYAHGYLLAKG